MPEAIEDVLWRVMRRTSDREAVRDLEEALVRIRLLRSRLERARLMWEEGRHVGVGHLLHVTRDVLGGDER